MTVTRFAMAVVFTAQLLFATTAFAECRHPKAPGPAPNGSTASSADMDAAKAALERYQKASKEYLQCADQEANARIATLGSNVEAIRQVKLLSAKRTKEIEDDLQAKADELNDQLRAYKLNNRE